MKNGVYGFSFFLTPVVIIYLFFDFNYNTHISFIFVLAGLLLNLLLAFIYTENRTYSAIIRNTLLLSLVGSVGILIGIGLLFIVALGGSGGR